MAAVAGALELVEQDQPQLLHMEAVAEGLAPKVEQAQAQQLLALEAAAAPAVLALAPRAAAAVTVQAEQVLQPLQPQPAQMRRTAHPLALAGQTLQILFGSMAAAVVGVSPIH